MVQWFLLKTILNEWPFNTAQKGGGQIACKVTVGGISLGFDFQIQSSIAEFFHKASFPFYFKD